MPAAGFTTASYRRKACNMLRDGALGAPEAGGGASDEIRAHAGQFAAAGRSLGGAAPRRRAAGPPGRAPGGSELRPLASHADRRRPSRWAGAGRLPLQVSPGRHPDRAGGTSGAAGPLGPRAQPYALSPTGTAGLPGSRKRGPAQFLPGRPRLRRASAALRARNATARRRRPAGRYLAGRDRLGSGERRVLPRPSGDRGQA